MGCSLLALCGTCEVPDASLAARPWWGKHSSVLCRAHPSTLHPTLRALLCFLNPSPDERRQSKTGHHLCVLPRMEDTGGLPFRSETHLNVVWDIVLLLPFVSLLPPPSGEHHLTFLPKDSLENSQECEGITSLEVD